MASVLKSCTAAVLPDSGPMHVAGVLGVPTIAIFGRVIPPENRVKYYDSVIAKQSDCPFTDEYCYYAQFNIKCGNTSFYRECMDIITVDYIINCVNKLITTK